MFIYEFKSGSNCLISKIVISGQYLTVYTSKENCCEFQDIISSLNLKCSVSGDHPFHTFCHTPFIEFSEHGSSIPHKHLRFPDRCDRTSYLKQFLEALIARQCDLTARQLAHTKLLSELNDERESYGDTVFPQHIQQAIDDYDLDSPFIPSKEMDHVLAAFASSLQDTSRLNIEEVSVHAQQLFDDNWDVLYNKHYICMGNDLTDDEIILCNYYDSLLALRISLLAIMSMPNNAEYVFKVNTILQEIRSNKFYLTNPTQSSFHLTIDSIAHQNNKQLNGLRNSSNIKRFLMGYALLSSYLLYTKDPEDSVAETALSGFVVSTMTALLARCTEEPVMNCWNSAVAFFSKKNNETREPSGMVLIGNHLS